MQPNVQKTLFESQKAQDAFVVMAVTAEFAQVSAGNELASNPSSTI
jgi:hypothetical protein